MDAEGWYRDPYGLHSDRWFSVGRPTALVRDAGVESQDEPPPGEIPGPLVEIQAELATDGSDLKRADAATSGDRMSADGNGIRAVLDKSAAMGTFFSYALAETGHRASPTRRLR